MSKTSGIVSTVGRFMYCKENTNGSVYRVSVTKHTNDVHITCLGMKCVDTTIKGHYMNISETPLWVQEKVALLMITDRIEGIGERHYKHRNIFYIHEEQIGSETLPIMPVPTEEK